MAAVAAAEKTSLRNTLAFGRFLGLEHVFGLHLQGGEHGIGLAASHVGKLRGGSHAIDRRTEKECVHKRETHFVQWFNAAPLCL
jgi:hypothetical protein